MTKQALMGWVRPHPGRGEVERVVRDPEPFAGEHGVKASRHEERDVVSAINETVRGLHERRDVAKVGRGRNDDTSHD
jgi:hypothetical protein